MNVAQETLGLRRGSFSLPLSLLMSAFALLMPPENLTILLHRPTERSPTAHTIPEAHSPKPQKGGSGVIYWFTEMNRSDSAWKGALSAFRRQANELGWIVRTRSFGVQFEPRYIFRAGRLDQ